MAFSFRKMLSNINYFKKPDDSNSSMEPGDSNLKRRRHISFESNEEVEEIEFPAPEPDSTSKQLTSLTLPDSVKKFAAKKGSLSDTDILPINIKTPRSKKDKLKCKKLKLDLKKASKSTETVCYSEFDMENVENTPKHMLLDCASADLFRERLKVFDFTKSYEIFDAMNDHEFSMDDDDDHLDIESLSDNSDTDISIATDPEEAEEPIKMCRKVEDVKNSPEKQLIPSATPESFADVEISHNEEDRSTLLLNYQMKLEKLENFLRKMLSEFQFHIEVSKVFHCKSIISSGTLPCADANNCPKILGEITYSDINRGISPSGSWNLILEKEDDIARYKIKKQLVRIQQCIGNFVTANMAHEYKMKLNSSKSITHSESKVKPIKNRMSNKKRMKVFDYPDYRDAFIHLFNPESEAERFDLNTTTLICPVADDSDAKCHCRCHCSSPLSQTDSGLTTKDDASISNQSVTSSLGNFTLDSTTLSAYSESLDLIVSYNSFQDASLYTTMLQKAAIERITFYVQVHSIQLKCEPSEQEFETKNVITFHCPSCKSTEMDENGLLKHILSQTHCEKIHFLYKTAYIKKCMSSGKEIQPSTVLNPMTMYRDDNKIVCFGDAVYACSLCFENLIVGESILMSHCSEAEHIERREQFYDLE